MKFIVIIGPNGVGKSTTANSFLTSYPKSALVDSDWCRATNPFSFNKEIKRTITDNIFCLIHNYMQCKDIENIIFTYGFHGERKEIFDEVLQRLQKEKANFELYIIVLKCSLDENIRRMRLDGREESRIKRGIENTFYFYDGYEYPVIDTTELEIEQVTDRIAEIAGMDRNLGKEKGNTI